MKYDFYKVYLTQACGNKNYGTGVLCQDFDTLKDAVEEGKRLCVFKESSFLVKGYAFRRCQSGMHCSIGGNSDMGHVVYAYNKKYRSPAHRKAEKISFCSITDAIAAIQEMVKKNGSEKEKTAFRAIVKALEY